MDQISTNTMQENSQVFSQLIRQFSQTSVVIKQNHQYSGLYSSKPLNPSRFQHFLPDPLYKFPVLNATFSTISKGIFSLTDFTQANTIDIKKSLQLLKQKSPFKRGEFDRSLLYQVPNNSVNSDSPPCFNLADAMAQDSQQIQSSYGSFSSLLSNPPKLEISADKKELIMQLHMNFAAKQDERMLHSITPASSISLQQSLVSHQKVLMDSLSFHSDQVVFNPDNEEISEILWEEKKDSLVSFEEAQVSIQQIQTLPIAELIPETQRESSSLYDSQQIMKRLSFSSWEQEIPAEQTDTFPSRLFLQVTASKHKLSNCPVFPGFQSKNTDQTINQRSAIQNQTPEIPDLNSPLYRKLVLCYTSNQQREPSIFHSRCNAVDIFSSIAVSGFSATPNIMYSNQQFQSKGYIEYSNNSPINTLFSVSVIHQLTVRPILQVSLGFEHCLALTSGGQIFSWGYGASGCLGHGSTTTCPTPSLITAISEQTIVYVQSGAYHNAALTEKGEIWLWGRGDVQQLGVPISSLVKDEIGYLSLVPIKNKSLSRIKQVACGEGHTVVLNSQGQVFSFGWGEYGQLGYQIQSVSSSIKEIRVPERSVKISCGTVFSVCLTIEGEIYTWGSNDLGQLGIGKVRSQCQPVLVELEEKALDVLCGESSVLCLLSSGKVFGWGMGKVGEFGGTFSVGSDIVCYKPRELSGVDIAHRYLLSNL